MKELGRTFGDFALQLPFVSWDMQNFCKVDRKKEVPE